MDLPLGNDGIPAERVIDELVAATEGGHLGSAGGRFFAWVIGGALPSALAADWLTSTWDNNAALYACGPAASVVEEVAGAWVKEVLDLPRSASFAFTTGCQMAHFTCLAAARHALLRDRGWNVERDGLTGAPAIRILASEQRHGSIERALRFLGIGTAALVPLTTDADARVTADVLSIALKASDSPTIVILDAADLNVAAIDPFSELIPIARAAGAWVHIDGAFGLWARASEHHQSKLAGVELAHSWATDAHKWLNTPKDIGIALITDSDAHRAAMEISADYLTHDAETRDQINWTPDWTRRARGFAVYAALRELGRAGVADLIDRSCVHAAALANGIAALHGAELVFAPTLNQALVRFLSPEPNALAVDHDARTASVIAAINAEGTAFFSGTVWRGRRAMRISVVNWRTSDADVHATIAAVARVLTSMDLN
ncbi:pyridoxal phosphate-dependent decarboxylase family protein [Paenibacillus radicis (ex Gao et al. 2016)]|uniref:pyridoxal phosphate-dependent decarboxylase family protein n=1 Tax=Paenibacillus radicis (ex Gao et al. 2016) TaxID=1737354 RepID=UPI001E2ECC81|nr:pyridoxal-dependent decarboxylase [Paenibacillus radicis (ex Gao et al. 2016)]